MEGVIDLEDNSRQEARALPSLDEVLRPKAEPDASNEDVGSSLLAGDTGGKGQSPDAPAAAGHRPAKQGGSSKYRGVCSSAASRSTQRVE